MDRYSPALCARFPRAVGLIGFLMLSITPAFAQETSSGKADSSAATRPYQPGRYQDQSTRRAAWIESQGLQKRVEEIKKLFEEAGTSDFQNRMAQQWAVLYTPSDIVRLRSRGINIIPLVGSRSGSTSAVDQFVDQTDIMLIGEVIDVNRNAYNTDDYASTITILVHEVLKGDTTLDTIRIRQFTGSIGNGIDRDLTSDFDPVKKIPMLFQVSRRLYPLYVVDQGGIPVTNSGPLYVMQENPRAITSKGTLAQPAGCLFGVMTEHAVTDIRTSLIRYKE